MTEIVRDGRFFLHFVPEKRRSFHVLSHVKEARTLAASGPYREIPVARELLSDFLTPIQPCASSGPGTTTAFCWSPPPTRRAGAAGPSWGFEPELEITAKDGVVQLRNGERTSSRIQRPGEALRQILSEHKK